MRIDRAATATLLSPKEFSDAALLPEALLNTQQAVAGHF